MKAKIMGVLDITFPPDCDSPRKRTEYAYRAQELLRRLHNVMGDWYREGITLTKWQQLPQKAQTRYPYSATLSEAQWHDFLEVVFNPISHRISTAIGKNRALLIESTQWNISADEV